ncbi:MULTISPECIES: serine hydrolase [unclassified Crossiella]|uniref:serine hydrolase n=1 Tax=unclassified Crossiella TaxID=2620835 RepID=UPI001FFFF11B|nr:MULTISPECIES: serine hydrolase [unclassified Crossiella]MCK2242550.1 class A beta-lactamase-related serine hydrolase [Crossiella sp. S99.2]MCK2254420.1 class A beta-lactamase-related serine hydrolase [Crossiella sp. S99.1]
MTINRRRALGLGTVAAAGAMLGSTTIAAAQNEPVDDESVIPTSAAHARRRIERVYRRESLRAGGTWSSFISVTDPDGTPVPAVEAEADRVVEAYSVNKIAVAAAVLDKIDRGLLTLDQRVEVTSAIVSKDGDGIFGFDGAYPSSVTLGHAMANLLTVSDNTAVRLCGLVCPAAELNEILRAKGFTHTQVKPVANPNRFFLGKTTPRETHTLLRKLVDGTLLSAASTEYVLTLLRSMAAFTDGVRLELNSAERGRVATKAGWFNDGRNEAGIVFDTAGKPMVTYSLFASGEFRGDPAANLNDFSTTHPALRARVALGRKMVDAVSRITASTARSHHQPAYQPSNGG